MLVLAACAPLHPASTSEEPKPSAAATPLPAPSREVAKTAPAPAAAKPEMAPEAAPAAIAKATPSPRPSPKGEGVASRPAAPKAQGGASSPSASAPKAQAGASPPASAPKAQGEAPLDLKSLEQRLKETNAIGLMTKLSLKNQVDDLLAKFREYHRGQLKVSLAELRRPYELLLMKVLSLLQDGDPALANAINASREAIWSVLADREKFAQFT